MLEALESDAVVRPDPDDITETIEAVPATMEAKTPVVLIATFYPGPFFLAVFSSLAILGAMVSGSAAFLCSQRLFADRLNLWGKALLLLLAGLMPRAFVDEDAVAGFIQSNVSGTVGL